MTVAPWRAVDRGAATEIIPALGHQFSTMAKYPNDDLFESTTMSFGEHLEELRSALFKSLFGLVIGFVIGLAVAERVMTLIQNPLRNALDTYYIDKAVEALKTEYDEDSIASVAKFIEDERLVFEEIFIEIGELKRIETLRQSNDSPGAPSPEDSEATAATDLDQTLPAPTSNLVKSRIWKPINSVVKSLNAHEVFIIFLKAALISGAVIASPWIFFQIWSFVGAGLYPHEKRYVHVFLPFSVALFLAGVAMAFFFVFEPVLDFLFGFNKFLNIDPDPRISEWLSFVLFLPLGFGISFQLPLVMLFMERIGIFTAKDYWDRFRVAILVICVLSMFLTPADPISMLLMAVPLTVLYFSGIALCKWLPRRRSPFNAPKETAEAGVDE